MLLLMLLPLHFIMKLCMHIEKEWATDFAIAAERGTRVTRRCVWSNRNIMQNYYHFYFLELSLSEILSEKYCVQKEQRGFHYLFMYLCILYYIVCRMDGSFAKFFLQKGRVKKACYIHTCVHIILYNSSNNIFFMRKWMESSCLLV